MTDPTSAEHSLNDKSSMDKLLYMMNRLRDPETGCPWDVKQDFRTIAPFTLEETCEVLEAIANNDMDNLREELGDLLFQVVFHAQMANEEDLFDFDQVANGLLEKMIRRHPHVFPDGTLESVRSKDDATTSDQVIDSWQAIKQKEKQDKGQTQSVSAMPDKLPDSLPSLSRAYKLQKAATKVGFDWGELLPVIDKIQEEIQEVRDAVADQESQQRISEEIGDLLFSCVNLARHLKVDPDMAMRQANNKFEGRFRVMETLAEANGESFQQLTLDEMEAYWQQSKQ
ncbi:nucleoside triphosphate pyrophosphohydrolase [Endozoicomonas sp. OPT23]|uniref:nucleoside triphosphate pyrophosphohydrolase n=1 Tax=Endozoicomonas sp. OPT23 TaxID=2072845 RepID=UPI00129B4EC3|nr:nucleoside triphosphate pyrophosphohydrolase [Endozoicomonas sp. OPT23]MRI34863.1 nucleoside triphosphate pyrophosphohydrolase [Endozoicomonas sp. OPT23]